MDVMNICKTQLLVMAGVLGSIICKGQPDEGKITVYCPKNHER